MVKKVSSFFAALVLAGMTTVFAFAASGAFPDVDPNAYYADAVGKVAEKGLITGYSDGRFGPNDSVSRGQLAVIMERLEARMDSRYQLKPGVTATTSSVPTTNNNNSSSSTANTSGGGFVKSGLYYSLGTSSDKDTESKTACEDSNWTGKKAVVYADYKQGPDSSIVKFKAYSGLDLAMVNNGQSFIAANDSQRMTFNLESGVCGDGAIVEAYDDETGALLDRILIGSIAKPANFDSTEPTVTKGIYYETGNTVSNSYGTCDSDSGNSTVFYFDSQNVEDGGMILGYKISYGVGDSLRADKQSFVGGHDIERIFVKVNGCYDKAKVEVIIKETGKTIDTFEIQ